MATKGARDTPELIHWLAVLGDLTRLRILHLIEREELGETVRVFVIPIERAMELVVEEGGRG